MPLRTEITHEIDIEVPLTLPFFLKNIELVGKDNKFDWCWAACAVMVMRYLKVDWREEQDLHKLLCERVANIATKDGVRLADHGSCCPPSQCDTALSAKDITVLWEDLLNHAPKPQHQSIFDDPDALSKALVDELKNNQKPVEVGLRESNRVGHLVIIFGCNEAEKLFYVLDPDEAMTIIPSSILFERCDTLWFDLK